jgi:hypothetical protein
LQGEIAAEYLKRVSPNVSRRIALNLLEQAGISSAATDRLAEAGMAVDF